MQHSQVGRLDLTGTAPSLSELSRREFAAVGGKMREGSRAAFAAVALLALCSGTPSLGEEAQPQKAPQSEQGTPTPEASEPSVTVLGSRQAQSVLGKEVRSSANENMGRIVDVIVDRAGRVRAAVIDFGGFLGVGSRKVAVDWDAFKFSLEGSKPDVVTLALTRDQVKAAPEYKDKQAVVVLGASGGLQSLPPEQQ
jgi:hypothetical protein